MCQRSKEQEHRIFFLSWKRENSINYELWMNDDCTWIDRKSFSHILWLRYVNCNVYGVRLRLFVIRSSPFFTGPKICRGNGSWRKRGEEKGKVRMKVRRWRKHGVKWNGIDKRWAIFHRVWGTLTQLSKSMGERVEI